MDLQHGIVRGHTLKADIRMPPDRRQTTGVTQLVGEATSFLLLLAADHTDLVS